jgi:hypothetical protein
MSEITQTDLVEVLADSSCALREARDTISEQKQKIAAYETADRAESLIEKMETRGHHVEGSSLREKVANLLGSGRDLNVLEAAIDLTPPNGSHFSLGDDSAGNASSDLEAAILG